MIKEIKAEQTAGNNSSTATFRPYIPVKYTVCALYKDQTSAFGNHNSCMVQENDALHESWELISSTLHTSHGEPVWLTQLPTQVENFEMECHDLSDSLDALLCEVPDAEEEYPIKIEQMDNKIIITYFEGKSRCSHYPFDEYIGTVRAVFSFHTEYAEVK